MDRTQIVVAGAALLISAGLVAGVLRSDTLAGSQPVQREAAGADPSKGPHGGRLLSDGDFAVEVTIFERGVPPHFRVYCFDSGKPLDPSEVSLTIELHRLGDRVDVSRFTVEQDYLLGDIVVEEPHSFDVDVVAERAGHSFRWSYPSYEGRVALTPEAIQSSGLIIEAAGPATIKNVLTLFGRVVPNEDLMAHVIPRYSGVVREVRKRLGDTVREGEVVATVQSNESLQTYSVQSPIGGTITKKDVAAGEFAAEGDVIYTVADLRSVWIDLHIYGSDLAKLAIGQSVTVRTNDERASATGRLSFLSPFADAQTQTLLARVELPNSGGRWRPGWFVTGEVVVEEVTVPLAVKTSALQTFRDWDVVFMNEGNLFEVRPLELGRRDAEWVEVLEGLTAGQRYAAAKSFIIKADIGKSGASHDH